MTAFVCKVYARSGEVHVVIEANFYGPSLASFYAELALVKADPNRSYHFNQHSTCGNIKPDVSSQGTMFLVTKTIDTPHGG